MSKPSDLIPPERPFASDRGVAKYFHGRKDILQKFTDQMREAKRTGGGTIFLVQAAPGAGKTALLAECRRIAELAKWETAEINSSDLWDTNTLLQSLDQETKQKEGGWSGHLEGGVDVPEVGSMKAGGGYESKKIYVPRTTLDVLNDGKEALLLILDEAQRLLNDIPPPPNQQYTLASTLTDSIHNGKIKRPVILLAGGLGFTESSFEYLAVSRIEGDAFVGLGPLSEASTRLVIKDWLVNEGGAEGNPNPWIDRISPETHGWPQHILAYMKPAIRHLGANAGRMTPTGLKDVLEEGRERRVQYYTRRGKGLTRMEREAIARFLFTISEGERFAREDLVAVLKEDLGSEVKADSIFNKAFRKGILDERDGEYIVPIPSMHNWFVDEYGPNRDTSIRPVEMPSSDLGPG